MAAGATAAPAATWHVEKDGSGDFTVIQNAVDASAAGDTIMIGPGRFDDFHQFWAPAWQTEVIVNVTQDDLTFIGAGRDVTIIGPVERHLLGTNPEPMAVISADTVTAKFVSLGIETTRDGIHWAYGRLEIEDCRFAECQDSLHLYCEGGASVSGSDFASTLSPGQGIITFSPCGPVSIEGCTFNGPGLSEDGISITGTVGAEISNCNFSTSSGISFAGSSGSVVNCTTTSDVDLAVWVTDASQVQLRDSSLHGNFAAIYINGWSVVSGSGNRFTGGADLATIYITSQSEVTLNGNDILKDGQFAARIGQYFYEIMTNDLTGNHWGSSDPDSVAAWVWDYNDDPVTRAYIDYVPIAEIPLPAQRSSFGGLKAMFRNAPDHPKNK